MQQTGTNNQNQNNLARNNDHQIRINTRLFDATHQSLQQLNDVIGKVNPIDGDFHLFTAILHKAMILATQVAEITRACQLAKTGVVNTNLLGHEEMAVILSEVRDLPYQNAVVEFSRPTILTNGTALLYIVAMPKVTEQKYRMIYLYPMVIEGKQVILQANKVATTAEETYIVFGKCLSIGNTTVCQEKDLRKQKEDTCIPRLLKGGHATCSYLRSNAETIMPVDDGTIFLTNFNGSITGPTKEYNLKGSYIIQYSNETIAVKGRNYSSHTTTHLMAIPAVLSKITATKYELSLEYVHDFSLENIKRLSATSSRLVYSCSLEIILVMIILVSS